MATSSNGGWTSSSLLAAVQLAVVAKLQGVRDIGASVRVLPADLDTGSVQRSAIAYVVASSIEQVGGSRSSDPLQTSRASSLTISVWIIIAGFELQTPRGVLWLSEQIEMALDGKLLTISNLPVDIVCYVGGLSFTSEKGKLWQYKMPLSISVPWSTSAEKV